jgi:diguanylate cyclase (GGDEF)-like protein
MFDNTVFYTCIFFAFILVIVALYFSKRIKHFRILSETDQMTSLMNYRGLCRKIERLLRHNISFSLAIIDIDNFRVFNKHSYKLGDEVLKEFSVLLSSSFTDNTIISRFRIGDEFILVFPNTSTEKAKTMIEEVKERCKKHTYVSLHNFSNNTLTFTEGIVETSASLNTIENLFSEAENSLKINKSLKLNTIN